MQVMEKPVTWAQERDSEGQSSSQRFKRVLSTLSYVCVCVVCVCIHIYDENEIHIHIFCHSISSSFFDSAKVAENPLLLKKPE